MADSTHHVCVECEGVGEKPGVCSTEDCGKQGDPLKECSCDDGSHGEVLENDMDMDDDSGDEGEDY